MPRKTTKKTLLDAPQVTMQQYVDAFCDAPLTRKAVIDLSSLLAKVIGAQLQAELPHVEVKVGHKMFGGVIRQHHLDAFVSNEHYGLQLGVDVKGLNSGKSVGKNWNNRIGDFASMANNHHQHAPKAVMGGVLAIPYEGITPNTLKNIEQTLLNLQGRRAYANAHNIFEAIALIVISKESRKLLDNIPDPSGPLRVERFAKTSAELFRQRFPT